MKAFTILALALATIVSAVPATIQNGAVQKLSATVSQSPNDGSIAVASTDKVITLAEVYAGAVANGDVGAQFGRGYLCYNQTNYRVDKLGLIQLMKEQCADLTYEGFGPIPPAYKRVSVVEFNSYKVRFMLKNNLPDAGLSVTYEVCMHEFMFLTSTCTVDYRQVRSGWLNNFNNWLTTEFLILSYIQPK